MADAVVPGDLVRRHDRGLGTGIYACEALGDGYIAGRYLRSMHPEWLGICVSHSERGSTRGVVCLDPVNQQLVVVYLMGIQVVTP